jgi:hypothetical protein
MKILHTESADMTTFEESGWTVMPLNVPALLIEPPSVSVELHETKEEQVVLGDIDFIPAIGRRHIDMLTHRALLEESVTKHREIWKTLAKK